MLSGAEEHVVRNLCELFVNLAANSECRSALAQHDTVRLLQSAMMRQDLSQSAQDSVSHVFQLVSS